MRVIPLRDLALQEARTAPSYAFARRQAGHGGLELSIHAVNDAIYGLRGENEYFFVALQAIGVARWPGGKAEPMAYLSQAALKATTDDPASGFWLPGVSEIYGSGLKKHKIWWQLTCDSAVSHYFVPLQIERDRQARALRRGPAEELQTLGLVERPVNLAVLKIVWKRSMQTAHPDRGGSLAAAQRVNAAYEKLRSQLEAEAALLQAS